MKKIMIAAAVLMVLALSACTITPKEKTTAAAETTQKGGSRETTADKTPATEAPATEAPATEAPATEAPATEVPTTPAPATTAAPVKEAYQVGDTVTAKNVTLVYVASGEYESDNQFIQPADGCLFVYFELEFENISSKEQSVSSLLFNCYADGRHCDSHLMVRDDDLSATLSAGRKTKGTVVFEVPADAAVIELEYETSLVSGDILTFRYAP
jgi:hypothetical protein